MAPDPRGERALRDPALDSRVRAGGLRLESWGYRWLSCPLAVSCSDPASGIASRIYMGERPVCRRAGIYAAPSYQRRVCPLDAIDRILNDFGICNIHAPVVIQVVHLAITIVVDEDVIGIAVHVSAERRASSRVPSAGVVLGGSETAHHANPIGIDAQFGQLRQHQFVLVDHLHVYNDVLWPHVLLIVRQEVFELEVLRELSVLVFGRHFDEAARRCVADTSLSFARVWAATDVIETAA